jgi:hypothetical protein
MVKKNLPFLILSIGLIMIVIIWSVYLMNQVKVLEADIKELELKNQMLQGDIDILSYDLVTARDSLRILNLK